MSLRNMLHALLCLVLILNGFGIAVAGTQMHRQHATLGEAMPASATVHSDCMDHATATAEASQVQTQADVSPSATDCCDNAACAFACAAGAVAALPDLIHGFQPSPQTLHVLPPVATHATPAIRVRYRPPIV